MAALGFKKFFAAGFPTAEDAVLHAHVPRPSRQGRARRHPRHHSRSITCSTTSEQGTGRRSRGTGFSRNIQPSPFPENLMSADPDFFIEKKLSKTKLGVSFFGPAALAEYKRYFLDPATIRAICEDVIAPAPASISRWTPLDFEAGTQDRLPGACFVGRVRQRRPQQQSGRGRDLDEVRDRHPRRQGAAVRPLPLGRGAGGYNLFAVLPRLNQAAKLKPEKETRGGHHHVEYRRRCRAEAAPLVHRAVHPGADRHRARHPDRTHLYPKAGVAIENRSGDTASST